MGGAHIIHRSIIKKVGHYDERFGVGSKYYASEESDYFFRIKQCGEKVLYCPELVVYHPSENNPSASKVFGYSCGLAAVITKHLISDIANFHYYFLIISRRLIISFIRTLQYAFFPKSIEEKNRIYKYKYFFRGTVRGIFDYLRFR